MDDARFNENCCNQTTIAGHIPIVRPNQPGVNSSHMYHVSSQHTSMHPPFQLCIDIPLPSVEHGNCTVLTIRQRPHSSQSGPEPPWPLDLENGLIQLGCEVTVYSDHPSQHQNHLQQGVYWIQVKWCSHDLEWKTILLQRSLSKLWKLSCNIIHATGQCLCQTDNVPVGVT